MNYNVIKVKHKKLDNPELCDYLEDNKAKR